MFGIDHGDTAEPLLLHHSCIFDREDSYGIDALERLLQISRLLLSEHALSSILSSRSLLARYA